MELPRRDRGDELCRPGELVALRDRLRVLSRHHDLVTVIACAFDHRTRMLPFIYADTRMAPAGVRAIGSALLDSGFAKTRIVLQQWNPNFRPAEMRLDHADSHCRLQGAHPQRVRARPGASAADRRRRPEDGV